MPSAPLLPSGVAGLLGRGGTVVTGNQRAARTLRLAFDRQHRADGLFSWQPPAIFAWDTWTASLYRQLLLSGYATRILLNRTQELRLWRSVIEADSQWRSLQTVDALAAMAADAWQLLCSYRGRERLGNLAVSADTRSFQRWAQAFTRRCVSGGFLSAPELEEALIAVTSSGHPATPGPELLFLGFDTKTPAQQALVDALRNTSVSIDDHPFASLAERLHLAAVETPHDELSQTALWIRKFLIASPHATVAVIVPSLAAERREIDRVFRHTLAPELVDIAAPTAASPYEFSLGQPLASTSLVSAAVGLLRLVSGAVSITDISRLLLSPFFAAGQNELPARAEFDAFELRPIKALRRELSLNRLIPLVSRPPRSSQLSSLLRQLRSLERTAGRLLADPAPRQRSHSDWAEAIRELLQSSGWPGSEPLDSVEFQTRQKFEDALDELATLDFEGTRATFAEALAALEAILERTLFAPESRDAPVQIMSPLEAAGSRFDAICFLRASDLEWPVRPGIDPLLGWRLQRALGMPGSDAALDYAHARRITNRIAASAATVVFSYAEQTEDSRLRPSPLVATLRPRSRARLKTPPASAPVRLEPFADDLLVPLANLIVHGGAGVLKSQAACGFRAFAEHRLRSTPIDTPEPGMDLRERGNIVHTALEHLWDDLRTQAALRVLTPEQRSAQLTRSIDHSLRRAAAGIAADSSSDLPADPWATAYLDLQRRRFDRLLGLWLDRELTRPAFAVAVREASERVTIGPLSLNIRIDRVDRLLAPESSGPDGLDPDSLRSGSQSGGTILIDYKTGMAKPSDWTGDRPDEPQLPLYAVLREPDSLAAVAFANIRSGKDMGLHGYAAREGILPGSSRPQFPSFQAQLEDWRRVLTSLAADFAAGDARVDPKSYPGTCKHCAQRLFCRLDPTLLARDSDEDQEESRDPAEAAAQMYEEADV